MPKTTAMRVFKNLRKSPRRLVNQPMKLSGLPKPQRMLLKEPQLLLSRLKKLSIAETEP